MHRHRVFAGCGSSSALDGGEHCCGCGFYGGASDRSGIVADCHGGGGLIWCAETAEPDNCNIEDERSCSTIGGVVLNAATAKEEWGYGEDNGTQISRAESTIVASVVVCFLGLA